MTTEKKSQVEEISYDEQEYLERTALLGLEYVLADFAREFQTATRRWERIAWPAMIVFALLAISGFWLIYSITEDMHRMSQNIDPQMSQNLGEMSKNIAILTQHVVHMEKSVTKMNANIANMDTSMSVMRSEMTEISDKMDPLLQNIAQMNQSIYAMTWNTGVMSEDMNRLNRNIGKPMRFMNNFIP